MALHFPLQVNGNVIGYFAACRRELVVPEDGVCTYDVTVETTSSAAVRLRGRRQCTVRHRYDAGAWELVRAALAAVGKGGDGGEG